MRRASPPSTGTSHVSHGFTVPYRISAPSGENVGLSLSRGAEVLSWVSCTGSPAGRIFTYTSPGLRKVWLPLMNASKRPSGDNAGYTAASVKKVSCSHLLSLFGAVLGARTYM